MISHINLGTNDLTRAENFYSELLKPMGAQQVYKSERTVLFSLGSGDAKIAINTPFNGDPATVGNGSMVALAATDKDQVHNVHAKALELGGSCEGEPGERLDGMLYAAYFRDLDGNKFGVFRSADA